MTIISLIRLLKPAFCGWSAPALEVLIARIEAGRWRRRMLRELSRRQRG